MHVAAVPAAPPRTLPRMLNWGRLRFTFIFSLAWGLLISTHWKSGLWSALTRTELLGFFLMLVFGLFERWPKRLPRWIARWALQVVAVAVSIPPFMAIVYAISTAPGAPPFYQDPVRMQGFSLLTGLGMFVAPWVALGTVIRQKEALARHLTVTFDLERSELERQALDARMRLLQAQVAPHFLFNTLANVQALVDSGSPQASAVLQSLVAYLRAAVPRLDEPATAVRREVELVRAYLELMHMRMPDRLQFHLHTDEAALSLRCPPMTLLTLVENAVRHGIDPTEDGGRIDIWVQVHEGRCWMRVSDTGAGLRQSGGGLGTGLSTLRERLQLSFGEDVHLRVTAQHPRGVLAELAFSARDANG